MPEALEIVKPAGIELVSVAGERVTVGRDATNDIDLAWDPTVSRAHALLERYPSGWSVRDLGSSNGTFVNGKRIWAEQALNPGDEIRVGSTSLRLRGEKSTRPATVVAEPPPELTHREVDVLTALCRPLLGTDTFPDPASVEAMASELTVTEAAVKQHLLRLYMKFDIEEGRSRRLRLANEAIRRRAVSPGELA